MKAKPYPLPTSIVTSLLFIASALLCWIFADLSIVTRTPWQEFFRMASGALSPQWLPWPELLSALAKTLAFGLLAVALSALVGFFLCLYFHTRGVKLFCASIRAVHELFWGLLFIQLLGLHPAAGLLAIAIPYSGIFAKVFAEIIEESEAESPNSLPPASDKVSQFFYGKWPRIKQHFANYTLYRLECGLRSSTVLGFIGLPTIGFHLESGFMQGNYGLVASMLLMLYALIASIRVWARFRLMPLYAGIAAAYLWAPLNIDGTLLISLVHDMSPLPLRSSEVEWWPWFTKLASTQIFPGALNTVLITQIALVLTGVFSLMSFPLLSKQFFSGTTRHLSHLMMVVLRSTPEIILAFVFLLLWGPSMLPAAVALAVHNGAITSHLLARHSNEVELRLDASRGMNRYLYEVLPRIYGQFLAFLCYRWEVIMRETAIVGILGIHTLGFYIDSAFESFRLDVAVLLIAVSAIMNIFVDEIARRTRRRLHLVKQPLVRAC